MNIEKILRKDGIEVISPLKYSTIQNLAKSVSEKMCKAFPELNIDYKELYDKLSSISMYYVTCPEGMSEANYLYKNSSIYFKFGLEDEDLEKYAVHEIIHYLQTCRDKKNYLVRLGLCDLSNYKIYGLALNEAAVQYMTSHVLQEPHETVKYYGISLSTNSSLIYPLLCSLISQMAFLVGDYPLFHSTLMGNSKFEDTFSDICGRQNFKKIEANFDTILFAEEKIIQLSNKLASASILRVKRIQNCIAKYKEIISSTYLKTQKLIYTSYFDANFNGLFNKDSISNFRNKLYNLKPLLGTVESDTSFDDYYLDMMIKLDEKDNFLKDSTYLVPIAKKSAFLLLLNKLKCLFKKAGNGSQADTNIRRNL